MLACLTVRGGGGGGERGGGEEEEEEEKKLPDLTVFAVSPTYVPYPAVVDACRPSNEINAALE